MDPVFSIESAFLHSMYSYLSHDSHTLFINIIKYLFFCNGVRRVSAVGVANLYELRGPRIESLWGRNFPHRPPVQWVTVLFPGGKVARALCRPPTPSTADVNEGVELYLYSSIRLSVVCSRVNLTFVMKTLCLL